LDQTTDAGRTLIMSVVTFPQDIFEGAIYFHVSTLMGKKMLIQFPRQLNQNKKHLKN